MHHPICGFFISRKPVHKSELKKNLRKIFRLLKRTFFDISNDYSKISTNIPSNVAEFDIEREFIYKKSLPEVTQIPEMFTKKNDFQLTYDAKINFSIQI